MLKILTIIDELLKWAVGLAVLGLISSMVHGKVQVIAIFGLIIAIGLPLDLLIGFELTHHG